MVVGVVGVEVDPDEDGAGFVVDLALPRASLSCCTPPVEETRTPSAIAPLSARPKVTATKACRAICMGIS
ncbi:hypothetical protein UC35_13670 [Ramlibacter tataouinensis]|uniref:Uncharacterized protein n=1 Tax=Ramlibacter tataouinensis TaxID=94132 RepID=A0A127JV02_9BURK|nr:hypothetical protein UC35_13670 [Ramlibacter tataouinensis]